MPPPVRTIPQTKVTEHSRPEPPILLPHEKCVVVERDGAATVVFQIDPADWRRYKTRIGDMNPSDYLWDNVLRRAVTGHIY